jgi:transposase, IS5 family
MRQALRQQTFADMAFEQIPVDPILETLSVFFDDHPELLESIRRDLERPLRKAGHGRSGLRAQQVLRALVLRTLKNWDLRELGARIADGITLRRFTLFFSDHVPGHDAFHRAFRRLTPETLASVNEMVVRAALTLGVEHGQKLRIDTTLVETNVHFPTDATLLWDAVRVLTRLTARLLRVVPDLPAFSDHTRRARRRMQEIQRMTRGQRRTQQTPKYRDLIAVARRVLRDVTEIVQQARVATTDIPRLASRLSAHCEQIEHVVGLCRRVIHQTRERVLKGRSLSAQEKLYSIFQPHTDVIVRGKERKPVEFGHKLMLAETASGLITEHHVLDGNPTDEGQLPSSLRHHLALFDAPPKVFAADRGFYSQANLDLCTISGVALACLPQRGGQKTPERAALEHSPAFRQGQRFRAGIEGRISVLLRRGMKRCPLHGRDGFEKFVAAAILVNNLLVIVFHLMAKKRAKKRNPQRAA